MASPVNLKNPTLKGGQYFTVKQFKNILGKSNTQTIYRALRQGRVTGAVRVGKTWLIPAGAIIIDSRVKHGLYIGIKNRIKDSEDML